MKRKEIEKISTLLRRELVPATGCTEPASIALAVAYASDILQGDVASIEVSLSQCVLKNAMGVGIPGTDMIGIPIAIALGWVIATPRRQLEILNGFDSSELRNAKNLVDRGIIKIHCKKGEDIEPLYIEVVAKDTQGNEAKAVIRGHHTNLTELSLGDTPLVRAEATCPATIPSAASGRDKSLRITFSEVYDYAMEAPLEEIDFIYQGTEETYALSEYARRQPVGHKLGMLHLTRQAQRIMGDNPLTHMIRETTMACDARMHGAPLTVMSNSGSGNQGISASLPVYVFAREEGAGREETTRALTLSNLMVIYVKQKIGRLSSLCGMIYSSIGVAVGMTYLLSGGKEAAGRAVHNVVGNITGMICDGAKPSCSLKAASAIHAATMASLLALEDTKVTAMEGIIDEEVDQSIFNLARIGVEAMAVAGDTILSIMTSKG